MIIIHMHTSYYHYYNKSIFFLNSDFVHVSFVVTKFFNIYIEVLELHWARMIQYFKLSWKFKNTTTVHYRRWVCHSKVTGSRTTTSEAIANNSHGTVRSRPWYRKTPEPTLTRTRVLHRNASWKKYLRGVFNYRRRQHPNSWSDDPSGPDIIWGDPGVVWFRSGAAYSQRSGAVDDDSKKGVAITAVNLIWSSGTHSQSVCCGGRSDSIIVIMIIREGII